MDRNQALVCPGAAGLASLSARRAWIEIVLPRAAAWVHRVALRKESVDRNGMVINGEKILHTSLSARRAWIEMPGRGITLYYLRSLSARRAWIEIAARPGRNHPR